MNDTNDCAQCLQGWTCEKHPGTPWPHNDCAGPGMPCQNRACYWRKEYFPENVVERKEG